MYGYRKKCKYCTIEFVGLGKHQENCQARKFYERNKNVIKSSRRLNLKRKHEEEMKDAQYKYEHKRLRDQIEILKEEMEKKDELIKSLAKQPKTSITINTVSSEALVEAVKEIISGCISQNRSCIEYNVEELAKIAGVVETTIQESEHSKELKSECLSTLLTNQEVRSRLEDFIPLEIAKHNEEVEVD